MEGIRQAGAKLTGLPIITLILKQSARLREKKVKMSKKRGSSIAVTQESRCFICKAGAGWKEREATNAHTHTQVYTQEEHTHTYFAHL